MSTAMESAWLWKQITPLELAKGNVPLVHYLEWGMFYVRCFFIVPLLTKSSEFILQMKEAVFMRIYLLFLSHYAAFFLMMKIEMYYKDTMIIKLHLLQYTDPTDHLSFYSSVGRLQTGCSLVRRSICQYSSKLKSEVKVINCKKTNPIWFEQWLKWQINPSLLYQFIFKMYPLDISSYIITQSNHH